MHKKSREITIIVTLSIVFATIWHFSFNCDLLNPHPWKNGIMVGSVLVGLVAIEAVLQLCCGKQLRFQSSTANYLIVGLVSSVMAFLLTAVSATTMNVVEAETLALGSSSFGITGYMLECLVYFMSVMLLDIIAFRAEKKKAAAQSETEA